MKTIFVILNLRDNCFAARSFVIGKRFNVGSFKYLNVSAVENNFCNFKFG
jgi:hypothetical protein